MRVTGLSSIDWDSNTATGRFAVIHVQNVLNNLTFLNAVDGSTLEPDLAEKWTISNDATVITYNLRRDVKWHDGNPFNARDVLFTVNRARNPTDLAAIVHVERLRGIKTVEAPDDFTIRITLAQPSVSFLTTMSSPNLLVYPAHIPDIAGTWKPNPVGTGPFKFKSLIRDVSSEVVRNPSYFKKDQAGRQLPYLDGVRHFFIVDQALAFAAFRSGRVDCACGYSSDILDNQKEAAAQSIPGVKFGTGSTPNTMYFSSRPPWNNQKVRQAVHIGLDRKVLRDIVRGGTASYPPTYLLPRERGGKFSLSAQELLNIPGFREPKEQDFALARRLFQEAGVDPATITISIPVVASIQDFGEAAASLLLKIGVKATVRPLGGSADLISVRLRGDFDLAFTGGGGSLDDPADQITPSVVTGGVTNFGKFSNPKVDQLLAAQEREIDLVKRQQLIADLQRELLDWAVFVPMNDIAGLFAAAPYVEGFVLNRAFSVSVAHRVEEVWFNK